MGITIAVTAIASANRIDLRVDQSADSEDDELSTTLLLLTALSALLTVILPETSSKLSSPKRDNNLPCRRYA